MRDQGLDRLCQFNLSLSLKFASCESQNVTHQTFARILFAIVLYQNPWRKTQDLKVSKILL